MKFAFIVNPASGQGNHDDSDVVAGLKKLIDEGRDDIKYYFTEGQLDASVLADAIAKAAAPEDIVIVACGGDGTIQEVAGGVYGNDNAILGVYPCGSGNDFIRALGGNDAAPKYRDFEKLLKGVPMDMDVMRMTYETESGTDSRIVVNGINIGFDGNTAIKAHELKTLPGVSGTLSYVLAVAVNFIGKRGENLKVFADDKEIYDGPLLLSTVANGGFCGGGFESCPNADITDGLAEVLVIRDLPRRRLPSLIPKYMKGKLFQIKNIEDIAVYTRAKKVRVEPNNGEMRFVADGEEFKTRGIEVEMLEKAIRVLKIEKA